MPERSALLEQPFDLVVIGGGINGAGIARDAALRGLRVALVEQADLCHGTTRWSSRLIHGGLRYLEHFEFSLVRESLQEREILLRNAPHLIAPLPLLVPLYRGARRGRWKVRAGMWLYDLLSVGKSLPSHRMLDKAETLGEAPGLSSDGLLGAARYTDAQVAYPERLTVENALDAEAAGAVLLTYHRADRLLTAAGQVCGLRIVDTQGVAQELVTGIVINAAGPWVDEVLSGLGVSAEPYMGGTRGTHIVVERFDGSPASGCYVEATSDGRPFFILPWLDRLLIGTTDIRHTGDPDLARADRA
ncbi:MAG: glycerol-3-phosphate dehydrogenase/oxidase, partial [Gammaproteobacteria bacterium]|nr:glycerol-3-phosphate dehydrogenase/oxidase [Gammaproteobacteria bacterium]